MFQKTEIHIALFLFLAMMAGIGCYHIAQITGTIGGIAPANADPVMSEFDKRGNRR